MRNIIMGSIGVLWGGGVLIYGLVSGLSGGTYGAGQIGAMLFAVVMLGAGLYYLILGIRSLGQDDESADRPRRKVRRRRSRDDD